MSTIIPPTCLQFRDTPRFIGILLRALYCSLVCVWASGSGQQQVCSGNKRTRFSLLKTRFRISISFPLNKRTLRASRVRKTSLEGATKSARIGTASLRPREDFTGWRRRGMMRVREEPQEPSLFSRLSLTRPIRSLLSQTERLGAR